MHFSLCFSLTVFGLKFCCNAVYEPTSITKSMRNVANTIIKNFKDSTANSDKTAWDRLAYLTDTFGPRFSGSESLENALDWVKNIAMHSDELTVSEMPSLVPHWVRGVEWAYLTIPRVKKLHMVGLGMSIGSGGKNITSELLVVKSQEDLTANCSKAAGKIVLFNTFFTTYGETVIVRYNAGIWAESCGALAALIRSVGL